MRVECCNARTMAGPSKGMGAAAPFHRQLPRGLRPRPDSLHALVLFPSLPVSLKGCSLCGLMKRVGRDLPTPHLQCEFRFHF